MSQVAKDQLNLTNELARILNFTADVATAIRMNTQYSGEYDPHNPQHAYDSMWLADSLHNFMMLGNAILTGDRGVIVSACDMMSDSYAQYSEPPGIARMKGDHQGAFARHASYFKLEDGRAIFADIKAKVI